jgi:hypothetical protein
MTHSASVLIGSKGNSQFFQESYAIFLSFHLLGLFHGIYDFFYL